MNVELISVGTEILLGDIVNTNTAYLSKQLANLGINVYKQTTVGDNHERLLQALDTAFKTADTIIITGGLGPTDDDISRDVAAAYFGYQMIYHEEIWQQIITYLTHNRKGAYVSENNRKQAYVPEHSYILTNQQGTAPGLIIEKENQRIILLPGPPSEMKAMFETSVIPYFRKYSDKQFVSAYIRFFGIGESALEMKIKSILDSQTNPTLALYAKTGEVLLRVTASGDNEAQCREKMQPVIEQLQNEVGEYIYLIGDERVAETQTEMHRVVAQMLLEKNLTISVAESLTGGLITSSLVEQSGISQVLYEGLVCYSNQSKIETLGVNPDTIAKYGAVSEQTAREMVVGVAKRLNSDVAIATTGIAGPTSDGTNKPVGLVYIATYVKGAVNVEVYHLFGTRTLISERSSKTALNQLRLHILAQNQQK
ncbi:competence/damage-inducible protein A [Tuanshanicoccus lijuaniae]|uniref:competence/damage-inducible protein A n=1 Tax=Aerococcaceae bacterium zg-1292 TaxID=2774330 RepID=UPI001938C87A|nr:competence/damage-inducible protein A [Aerococcaceae bacterium zg-1292]QQA37434.1 competence/damage-inducible protein A [Aerococcaceae bacterium zg-1292]